MYWNKFIALVISCTLLLTVISERAVASESASVDNITLKQSPYSIGNGWSVDSTFSSDPPYSIAIGNLHYVAVGPYGSVMTSKNGRNWKATSKFNNYQLTTIAWNGSNYFMFGANTVYERNAVTAPSELFVSKDALTWEKVDFEPEEAIHYLIWSDNQFVAVGQKHVFTSSDGHKWTERLTLTDNYGMHYIHYEHSTYFIYGFESNKVYTSKDGVKWTTKSLDTKANVTDFVWVKDRYIGVGNGLFTSKDGIAWTKQSQSPSSVHFNHLYYDGKQFIAIGEIFNNDVSKQVSYTSKDGVNWTKHDLSNLQARIYMIYAVDGGYAGLGSNKMPDHPDGTYSMYSKDGASWTYGLVGTTSIGGDFNSIATNGKRTVAVGSYGSVIYTDDGSNWKSANPFSFTPRLGRTYLFDVAWGANKFVAVGNGGAYTSSNGVSWKKAKVTFNNQYGGNLRNILWTGTYFIASGQVDGVYYSKDGLAWSKVSSVSTDDHWLTSMVWDGKRIVATFEMYNNGNQYTRIMQSINGKTWTTLATINVMQMHIAWNGEKFVAVNMYDTSVVYTSIDAKNWTRAKVNSDPDNFEFITSFDGYFFAFNDSLKVINDEYTVYNSYYTSKDGVKWIEVAVNDPYNAEAFGNSMMLDGIKAHNKYIFVGANGKIMYANELQLGDPIVINVFGSKLNTSADQGQPYIEKGTTYVPLKIIGEALGYSISWDQKTKTVTFDKESKKTVFKNIQLKNGRSFVPLREISESLGYKVNYERTNQGMFIEISK